MQSDVKYSYHTVGIGLGIRGVHELLTGGRVPVKPRVQRLIANRELPVSSRLGKHGKLSSARNMLSGFSRALRALEVVPRGHIVVEVDFNENTAHIEYLGNEVEN